MTDSQQFPNGYQFMFTADFIESCSDVDLIVALLHWYVVHEGFKCENSVNLPSAWNENQELYTFKYTRDRESIPVNLTLKVLKMAEDSVMVHTSLDGAATQSVELMISKFLTGKKTGVDQIFQGLDSLKRDFDQLLSITKTESTASAGVNTESNYKEPGQPRDLIDPIGSLRAPPVGGPSRNPFDYGRADLDPFASTGSGGMIFPPLGPRRPQDMFPGRGSVPPGARFDPYGPPNLGPSMFGPDPDHLRMPGQNPRGFGNFGDDFIWMYFH